MNLTLWENIFLALKKYCIQNDALNDVIVISIRGKTSSQNINGKAKWNEKLELHYSLYPESMYVILYWNPCIYVYNIHNLCM